MVFNFLWNMILGIVGGIISSVIVSRVFLIQAEYQEQIKKIEKLMRKVGFSSGMFEGIRIVLEVSYDQIVEMQREMKEFGYKTEEEYYLAHKDKKWISEEKIVEDILRETKKRAQMAKDEIIDLNLEDIELQTIVYEIDKYMGSILDVKICDFSVIQGIDRDFGEICSKYESYKKISTKKMLKMILVDKVMVVLGILLLSIVLGAIASFILGV